MSRDEKDDTISTSD